MNSISVTNWERLRSLGPLEKYSTARHNLQFYFNVAVTATYRLSEGPLPPLKNHIYKACELLIAQHPSLSVNPVGEETRDPYFARLPEIDLAKCVFIQPRLQGQATVNDTERTSTDGELDELLQTQHNTPFTLGLPYWRLFILTDPTNTRNFTAVFVYHHAIGDGSSGKAFHTTLLRALQEAQSLSFGEVTNLIKPPSLSLLPNLEEVLPLPVSILYLAKAFINDKFGSRDSLVWAGSNIQIPLICQVRHISLSRSTTSALRKACRTNGTTITAALQTMMARIIFGHLPISWGKLCCNGAISVRSWLPDSITEDSIGVWVKYYQEIYKRNHFKEKEFFWNEAIRSRKTIEQALEQKGKNQSIGCLKYVGDYHHDLFLSKIGKPRDSSFELSNIGVYIAPRDDHPHAPEIGRMVFSQSASVTGNAIEVSSITGGDGCLTLAFNWQKSVLEPGLIEAVIEDSKRAFDELLV